MKKTSIGTWAYNVGPYGESPIPFDTVGETLSKLKFDGKKAKLELFEDEYGISPGQACVFYYKDEIGERVLGGGWISKN